MDKERKSEIHITNKFNAPIGQHIDHVDTINFRMDGEGNFQFGMVEEVKNEHKGGTDTKNVSQPESAPSGQDEELFHFVHPELDDKAAWSVHEAVKRVVARQGIKDICQYLRQLRKENKVLLPQSPSAAYIELVRLGMPEGKGFNESTFRNYYTNK